MRKKTWLVYVVVPCEMGSEGNSGWLYYCVAHGNTDEEIYKDWVKNVYILYGVDLSNDLKENNGYWSCYYPLAKNLLPDNVYGHAQPLLVQIMYQEHNK